MDRKKQRRGRKEIGERVRRSGSRGGCSEGCWQHRLLSRCYIEWVDEYLRRSTSCGFFFNQANPLVPSFSTVARLSHPSRRFLLAQIMARNESSCLCGDRERKKTSRSSLFDTLHGHISPVIFLVLYRSFLEGRKNVFIN